MTPELQAEIAGFMNRLPLVEWDRYVDIGDRLMVYGWVGRADAHSDFVLLGIHYEDDGVTGIEFTTSSHQHSEAFSRALYGDAGEHIPCERVEDGFPDLVPNAIRL